MMIVEQVTVPIDASELVEAMAVLRVWEGRIAELPACLRESVERVVSQITESTGFSVQGGREVVVELNAETRALIASLRAREA